jgi:hypothetical protein
MPVHRPGAVEHLAEPFRPHRQHQRQPDRPPQRIAPADIVAKAEDPLGGDAERGGLLHRRTDRGEMAGRLPFPDRRRQGGARAFGIRHRLERGEGLRGDQDQRGAQIDARQHIGQMRPVDVRHHMDIGAVGMGRQRAQRHLGPERRAADADMDDMGEPPAAGRCDRTRPHAARETRHPGKRVANLGPHIAAGHCQPSAIGVAQGHVQHRAALAFVDRRATEHRVAARAKPGRIGKREQRVPCRGCQRGAGIVEAQPVGLDRKRAGPAGIGGKQIAHAGGVGGFGGQAFPGRHGITPHNGRSGPAAPRAPAARPPVRAGGRGRAPRAFPPR